MRCGSQLTCCQPTRPLFESGHYRLFHRRRYARPMADTITLRRPDDWHLHLRDGAMLAAVLPFTARQFARAIIMPNLVPPVTDVASASAYRERILEALPVGADFTPLMTCYLTDTTDL